MDLDGNDGKPKLADRDWLYEDWELTDEQWEIILAKARDPERKAKMDAIFARIESRPKIETIEPTGAKP